MLFYTNNNNEEETLKKILQVTRISALHRSRHMDDFFEYILISYVLQEDTAKMEFLSRGQQVNLDESTIIKTQDFYECS